MSREKDLRSLDAAIASVEELISEPLPGEDAQLAVAMAWRKSRLEAADRLVALLERRSKLLGLDAEPGTKPADDHAETPIERIKRLAVVPKQGGT